MAAQRLVRKNCPHCLVEYEPDALTLDTIDAIDGGTLAHDIGDYRHGEGCVGCKGRGYSGRLAVLELMEITPTLRQLIADAVRRSKSASRLSAKAW